MLNHNKLAFSVNEFSEIFGVSRSVTYKLIKEGKLNPSKILGRTVITRSEVDRFAASLEGVE